MPSNRHWAPLQYTCDESRGHHHFRDADHDLFHQHRRKKLQQRDQHVVVKAVRRHQMADARAAIRLETLIEQEKPPAMRRA
jgi:hypothetical protein